MAWAEHLADDAHLTAISGEPPPDTEAAPSPIAAGRMARGLAAYQQVMGFDAEQHAVVEAAGVVSAHEGDYGGAEFLLRRSLQIAPTCLAYNTLGVVLTAQRRYDEAINCYRASLELDPSNTSTWPNLLFCLDLHPDATPALRLAERRRFDALHCRALTEAAAPHPNDPDPDRVLRVGYVSPDLKQHSAANGFAQLLAHAHPNRVATYIYDVDQAPENPEDTVAAWFKGMGHVWRDMRGVDDGTLAATIRADAIDILVDLSGYSAGSRVMAFARKPAPIQISGFGYATGLGISAQDYLVADPMLIPEAHEHLYHERPLRLPLYCGFEAGPPIPDVGPPPREKNGYVTYGYLGRGIKLSTQTLVAWSEILRAVPTARLLIKSGDLDTPKLRAQIMCTLSAHGVAVDRVEFRGTSPRGEHLAAYNDVDVVLDSFPHNGGVTSAEALLMGVPIVALLGTYLCGRTTAALLAMLGFDQAIARHPILYVKQAIAMATEPWTYADRLGLRRRLRDSVLLDGDAYARAWEDAIRDVWRAWCEQSRATVGAD